MSARGKSARALIALALLFCLAVSLPARGEVAQRGTLRVSLGAVLHPNRLPRSGAGPIAVSVSSRLATTDGSVPPQLKTLRIELNRHGRLDTAGLPECQKSEIQPASTARALAACRDALVGRGSFAIDVVLGGQEPYPTTGRLLLFNGTYRGKPTLLGQVYAAHPFANSFVIPFRIGHAKSGRYGVALSATLPPAFTSWGHITAIQMRLARRYAYRGTRHSFLSAGCPIPKGLSVAPFSVARVSLGFAGPKRLTQTLSGICHAH